MPTKIKTSKAVALAIAALEQPVITEYQLALLLIDCYRNRSVQGKQLALTKNFPSARELTRVIDELLGTAVLSYSKDFSRYQVFEIFGKSKPAAPDVACVIDPFCYVSHLSAMSYHGLSDRIPRTLFLSSPAPRL